MQDIRHACWPQLYSQLLYAPADFNTEAQEEEKRFSEDHAAADAAHAAALRDAAAVTAAAQVLNKAT